MSKVSKNNSNQDIIAGIFLLLAGINITVAFLTRFDYLSGANNISEDLQYLADNKVILQINSFLWLGAALLMTFASASLISSMSVYKIHSAYLTGFFFFLSAIMFLFAGLKGLGVIDLISYQDSLALNPDENDLFKASMITLSKERDVFIKISAALTGLGLFSTGLFSLRTRRIPLIHGLLCLISGLALPFFLFGFQESPLFNFALISSLFVIILVSIRLTFHGFVKIGKSEN